ncbi:MAG: hypothetical protein H0W78_13730 [Planctomycetes bacterium]|jgi:hypothetical protein|nr:hypothetical protein [Planctomycetota bacterium]
MIMADVLTWFLIILGTLLVFISHWLGAYGLFPTLVEGAAERYGRRPVAATFLGLAVLVPVLVLTAVLSKLNPALGIVALLILTVPVMIALLGSAGLALRVGTGLASPSDAGQPWRRVLRGGIVLALVFLLPLIGWFVMMPWALVSGLGAALMAMRGGRPVVPRVSSAADATAATVVTVAPVVSGVGAGA